MNTMTMSTCGMMMTTEKAVDVGYAKQHQYAPGSSLASGKHKRKHAVRRDDRQRWVTVCKEKPATREYKGWVETVDCKNCLKALGVES